MYKSLKESCKDFHLYIFAFDDQTHEYLLNEKLENITIISLEEFETKKILAVKKTRSAKEYCWTCTPLVILHSIEKYQLKNCTYIDADLFFFNDPKVLIEEMGNNSVLITEHRHSSKKNLREGIYCVQFVTFKNNNNGMEVLNWWADSCLDWCYDRLEKNRFGDQKYLDDWTTRFTGVHVLQNLGGGVAPWNCQQYDLENDNYFIEKKTAKKFKLFFYHFHHFLLFNNNKTDLAGHYFISSDFKKVVYLKYLQEILAVEKKIVLNINNYLEISRAKFKKNSFLRKIKFWLKRIKNIYSIDAFLDKNF